jgi:hypothetical protein
MGSADYALSEKSILSASYNFEQYSFDASNLVGVTANTAQTSFIHDLTRRRGVRQEDVPRGFRWNVAR